MVAHTPYDETLIRLHKTGPEFGGWLSNHGPMAADALIRIGASDQVNGWVSQYAQRLDELPGPRWAIATDQWRDPLGDASRLGDWLAFFARELAERAWQQVLIQWWPRLLPGAVAAATHPLIRTGHAVRALQQEATQPRVDELAQALGYWAARWTPLPRARPVGRLTAEQVLELLPAVPERGGARTRLAFLFTGSRWPSGAAQLVPPATAAGVADALNGVVDAAVTRYRAWAPAAPTMLVHMATAPRAAGLVLDSLPQELWPLTFRHAWATSAAIATMYRPRPAAVLPESTRPASLTHEDVAAAAAATNDEHAIKFCEVALESHARGNEHALDAAWSASVLAE